MNVISDTTHKNIWTCYFKRVPIPLFCCIWVKNVGKLFEGSWIQWYKKTNSNFSIVVLLGIENVDWNKSTKIYISFLKLSEADIINLHSLLKYIPKKDYMFHRDLIQLCTFCKVDAINIYLLALISYRLSIFRSFLE